MAEGGSFEIKDELRLVPVQSLELETVLQAQHARSRRGWVE